MNILPDEISIRRFVLSNNTNGFHLAARKIEYLDITFCIEGNMTYYIDNERVELSKGDAIIIPPGSIRMRYRSKSTIRYASFTVILPENFKCDTFAVIRGCVNGDILYLLSLFAKDWRPQTPQKIQKSNALFAYLYYMLDEIRSKESNVHIEKIKNIYQKIFFRK